MLNDPDKNMEDVTVAIKTIKSTIILLHEMDSNIIIIIYIADINSKEQLSAFLAESLIMKDFHHPHILGLLGVCFNAPDGSPYIVLPFMANGSVSTYLKEKRAHVLDVNSFPKVYKLLTCTCSLSDDWCKVSHQCPDTVYF